MPTILTLPFWITFRLLERFKHGKNKNKKKIEDFYPKKNISILSAFRYTLLSYERLNTYKKAAGYTEKGYLILSDRFPSYNEGKMDSPRVPYDKNKSLIYKVLYKLEKHFYSQICPSDLSFYLSVPVEVAIERNRLRSKSMKETDNEILARYQINKDLKLKSHEVIHVDATLSIEQVQAIIKKGIWSKL